MRAIALYLPQFHPIPENDEWWGKGFTEWTNTAKAKPLFRGHYQPHVPADLGFYDLRLPEARTAQAEMAREYGIEGFCYYHYWFAGRRVIERPFQEVLASGEPDFPFCLCWANQTWTGVWHGAPNRILLEQSYPGEADHRAHFESLLPAFTDHRYIQADGKPLFMIYNPRDIPDCHKTMDLWRSMAVKSGLPGLFLAAEHRDPHWRAEAYGFDAVVNVRLPGKRREWVPWSNPVEKITGKISQARGIPSIVPYESLIEHLVPDEGDPATVFPCVIPNWDNTPRSGAQGLVLLGSTPELFRVQLQRALEKLHRAPPNRKILFIKSWNEWAEGNYLEPDLQYGKAYLEVLRDELGSARSAGNGNTIQLQR